jgi:uracil-DNA glycosylase
MNKTVEYKQAEFLKLAEKARNCLLCEAMRDKTAVLSELNGNLNPKVFFIAEAPGRQGADRTRRPFFGDKSGANFQILLDSINLKREEIFVTNSVLCSPRSETGANRKPSKREIKNCSHHLARTIQTINPKIIVTLGSVALEALKAIEYHQFTLKADAARVLRWNGKLLVPLYHPSPQTVASRRRLTEQIADFEILGNLIEQIGNKKEQGEVV